MDDPGDDWGDTLGAFDVSDLDPAQRQVLSDALAQAGILHAYLGAELQGPASESERIEHLIAQVRRHRGDRRGPGADAHLPRALRLPWGGVPAAALGLRISARWRRFAAYLTEAVAFGIAASILYRYSAGGARIFAAAIGLTSSVILVALLGASIGMMVFRMRIVVLADPDRRAPGWRIAVVRYLVAWWPEALLVVLEPFYGVARLAWLSTIMQIWLIVCFGPILLDPARRGLHDRVAGTVVVDSGADGIDRGADR